MRWRRYGGIFRHYTTAVLICLVVTNIVVIVGKITSKIYI